MAKLTRPLLDLGAMAAPSSEENEERMRTLVATFNRMLRKDLNLINNPSGGSTDCATVINVPFEDPEAYLICEHELSHIFSETDMGLVEVFRDQMTEKLLSRAKIAITSPQGTQYKPILNRVVHALWNILEDWRCLSIWEELYFGGAFLLRKRWEGIAKYMDDEVCEKDLVAYVARVAAGTDTVSAPSHFQACAPHVQKAVSAVAGVDNLACLAVTSKLIDDIADELLNQLPPPDKDKLTNSQKALAKLQRFGATVPQKNPPAPGQPDQTFAGGAGTPDTTGGEPRAHREKAMLLRRVRKLVSASMEPGPDGKSEFQKLCDEGTERMNERIAAAKAELGKQRKEDSEEKNLLELGSSCGIRTALVSPSQCLVSPSTRAGSVRRYLEQVKMDIDRTYAAHGQRVSVQRAIQARLGQQSNYPIFQKTEETGGLQLLILADVSGSMSGIGLTLLDQAIADVAYACTGLRVDLHLWTYSSELYIFRKLGSLRGVPNMFMATTSTVQALDVAVGWLRGGRGDRAVILMTDGFPTSCRAHKSTGSPMQDLQNVMRELATEGVTLASVGIGNDVDFFKQLFGKQRFGHAGRIEEIPGALTKVVSAIIEAHLKS